MKIEDLILLVKNRLTNFQLARDYARMNGNLDAMNTADKEIVTLEDTLYQLNLLVDVSVSAAVKESTLTGVVNNGSVSILSEYDISLYATDPEHERKIMDILALMGVMNTTGEIDEYIKGKYTGSPVTGVMVVSAASAYDVDTRLMMALMELDSRFGTVGVATTTLNPGNVGNDDAGNTRTYGSWQAGVTAVAEWLSRHRGVTKGVETAEPKTTQATTTSALIVPTIEPQTEATTTPVTATTSETISGTATSARQVAASVQQAVATTTAAAS